MICSVLTLLFLVSTVHGSGDAPHWSYKDQDHWSKFGPTCAARSQSPIDIQIGKTFIDTGLKINFANYDRDLPVGSFSITNNGHTAQMILNSDFLQPNQIPMMEGTALGNGATDRYRFLQLHFHWHLKDDKGTEHSTNGQKFAMEMHHVHINSKYHTIQEAISRPDGLAVLGTMFTVTRKDNKDLDPIVSTLESIIHPKTTTMVNQTVQLGQLLPNNLESFFKYHGSLTTPPCSEAVNWILFSELSTVSARQMSRFRNITESSGDLMLDNVRASQPVNQRPVYASRHISSASLGLNVNMFSFIFVLVSSLVLSYCNPSLCV